MKVSELFEASTPSVEVNHGKVVDVLYALALQYFKAPAAIKQDAKRLARSTDEFWSSSFDDVTKELQGFYDDVSAGVDVDIQDFFESVDNAVEDSIAAMRGYYSNRMNHAPGFVPPKFQDDNEPIEVPGSAIEKAFASIAGFTEMVKAHKAAKKAGNKKALNARLAAFTPEVIEQLANLVDKYWEVSYGKAGREKIAKNPKFYDFAVGFAPKSEEELVNELMRTKNKSVTNLGTIAEWSWNQMDHTEIPKHINTWDVMMDDKLMRQIANKSKRLSIWALRLLSQGRS